MARVKVGISCEQFSQFAESSLAVPPLNGRVTGTGENNLCVGGVRLQAITPSERVSGFGHPLQLLPDLLT